MPEQGPRRRRYTAKPVNLWESYANGGSVKEMWRIRSKRQQKPRKLSEEERSGPLVKTGVVL